MIASSGCRPSPGPRALDRNHAPRNGDIFIFAWHPVTNETADHRDPDQWLFYVVAEAALPPQKTISLPVLQRLTDPVTFAGLDAAIAEFSARLVP